MFEVTDWDLNVIHKDIRSLLDEIDDIKKILDGFSNRIYELEKTQHALPETAFAAAEAGYQKPFGNITWEDGRPL